LDEAKRKEKIMSDKIQTPVEPTEQAKVKRKSTFGKFLTSIFNNDIVYIKDYIFLDVIVPAIKKGLYDVITNGADMFLYGGGSGTSKSQNSNSSYMQYYEKHKKVGQTNYQSTGRMLSGYDFDTFSFIRRPVAFAILDEMNKVINEYGNVAVSTYYEIVEKNTRNGNSEGVKPNGTRFTDEDYGWTDLKEAEVVRDRNGFVLELPPAIAIN
jgi:hypothetical protein